MEISRMLTLSTAHITPETRDILIKGGEYLPPYYPKGDCGWFIYVHTDFLYVDGDGKTWEIYQDAPDDLRDCLREAWENYCGWLCLDCDGPIEKKLPTYNW